MIQNKTLLQFFEWYLPADGEHWDLFAQQVPALLALGITATWLPPAYKGTRGPYSEGYDVYDLYDLGEFDQKGSVRTKYGTKEAYQQAVSFARAAGMQVYADVVLNHMGGAEETERIKVKKVNPDNRLEFISDEMEIDAYTRFTFPGRKGRYSAFTWDYHCFTGVDKTADNKDEAIYSILNEYGDDWEPMVNDEKGNFDYLMLNDIEMRNPAVREELKRWINWYYQSAPFDGIRLDAVKHINPSFFIEWLDYIHSALDPSLFVLGEYWLSDNLPVLLNYIHITGERMHLFDAPLHHNFHEASIRREGYDLRCIFNNSLVQAKPQLAITFVDNHDTQPLQALEEYTEQWFKPHAYAMILLRGGGYPCVFYADIYGAAYSGNNNLKEHCEIIIPPLQELSSLLNARKEYAYGEQEDYFDEANCIGWTRAGIAEKPHSGCAVIISNDAQRSLNKRMKTGKQFAGKFFYDCLGKVAEQVMIDEEGFGEFSVAPASVSVWISRQ